MVVFQNLTVMEAMFGPLIWVTSLGNIMKHANNYSVLGTACIGLLSCISKELVYRTSLLNIACDRLGISSLLDFDRVSSFPVIGFGSRVKFCYFMFTCMLLVSFLG